MPELTGTFLTNDFIFTIIVVVIAFILTYIWSDRVVEFLHQRSLGSRSYILQRMRDMFIEIDSRRVTITMVLAGAGPAAILFFVFWPNIAAGFCFGGGVAIGGWMLPRLVVDSIYNKRMSKLVAQMVDGLTIMANGIQAGLSVQQAMSRVAENMGNPISQEFGLVLQRIQVGNSLDEALNHLATRIPAPEVQMFVTAVNILNETGKGLAPTFNTIMETIRERQKVQKKIEALTAQGMMQGMIITLVPFIILILLLVLDPGFVSPLFTTTAGIFMLMLVLVLQIIGGVMIRKIVKINV